MGLPIMGLPFALLSKAEPSLIADVLNGMMVHAVEAHADTERTQGAEASVMDAYRAEMASGRIH